MKRRLVSVNFPLWIDKKDGVGNDLELLRPKALEILGGLKGGFKLLEKVLILTPRMKMLTNHPSRGTIIFKTNLPSRIAFLLRRRIREVDPRSQRLKKIQMLNIRQLIHLKLLLFWLLMTLIQQLGSIARKNSEMRLRMGLNMSRKQCL